MHEIKFEIDDITIRRDVASEWNELSLPELFTVAPLVMFRNKSRRLLNEITLYFIQLPEKYLNLMNHSQLQGLWPAVEWLFKKPTLTKNPLPEIKIGKTTFTGMEDGLKNITVSQFAFADKYMSSYLRRKEESDLDLIISTIYVQSTMDFDKKLIEINQKLLSTIDIKLKMAILAFYLGCRASIQEKHPLIFKKQGKARRKSAGWLGLFYDLAGPKTGTYEQVASMNLFEMLAIMEKLQEDAEEAERNARKNRRK